jgi:hypothetical protein
VVHVVLTVVGSPEDWRGEGYRQRRYFDSDPRLQLQVAPAADSRNRGDRSEIDGQALRMNCGRITDNTGGRQIASRAIVTSNYLRCFVYFANMARFQVSQIYEKSTAQSGDGHSLGIVWGLGVNRSCGQFSGRFA